MIRCSVGNQLLRLSILVVVFALTSDVYSQRIVRELESNSGDSFQGAFERDTIGMGNDDEEKENMCIKRHMFFHCYHRPRGYLFNLLFAVLIEAINKIRIVEQILSIGLYVASSI